MDKLNINFTPAQVLKAELMNIITAKIDEVVNEVNKILPLEVRANENRVMIENMRNSEVDISQTEFDALMESGGLDPSKTYYIYEG